jgi:hypothetical protein
LPERAGIKPAPTKKTSSIFIYAWKNRTFVMVLYVDNMLMPCKINPKNEKIALKFLYLFFPGGERTGKGI